MEGFYSKGKYHQVGVRKLIVQSLQILNMASKLSPKLQSMLYRKIFSQF